MASINNCCNFKTCQEATLDPKFIHFRCIERKKTGNMCGKEEETECSNQWGWTRFWSCSFDFSTICNRDCSLQVIAGRRRWRCIISHETVQNRDYWKIHSAQLQHLTCTAKDCFVFQLLQFLKREFSDPGNTVTKRTVALISEHVNIQIYLTSW